MSAPPVRAPDRTRRIPWRDGTGAARQRNPRGSNARSACHPEAEPDLGRPGSRRGTRAGADTQRAVARARSHDGPDDHAIVRAHEPIQGFPAAPWRSRAPRPRRTWRPRPPSIDVRRPREACSQLIGREPPRLSSAAPWERGGRPRRPPLRHEPDYLPASSVAVMVSSAPVIVIWTPFFLAALSALSCFLVSLSVTVVVLPLASARSLAWPAILVLPLPPA